MLKKRFFILSSWMYFFILIAEAERGTHPAFPNKKAKGSGKRNLCSEGNKKATEKDLSLLMAKKYFQKSIFCRSSDLYVQAFANAHSPPSQLTYYGSQWPAFAERECTPYLQLQNLPIWREPCSGLSPDSLVQQNKIACLNKRGRAIATKAGAICNFSGTGKTVCQI